MARSLVVVAGIAAAVMLPAAVAKIGTHAGAAWRPPSAAGDAEALLSELRIETVVYVDGGKVISRALSLFHEGKAYDYLDAANEVAVMEPLQEQFILLQPSRKQACRLSFAAIQHTLQRAHLRTQQQLEELAARTDAPSKQRLALGRFLLDPQWDASFEPKSGWLQLRSDYVVYRIQGVPLASLAGAAAPGKAGSARDEPALASSLKRYWDWHARLNRIVNPSGLPPEVRLTVNRELLQRRLVPTEVELDIRFGRPLKLRSTHETQRQLTPEDLRRLETTRRELKAARFVSFEEYQGSPGANP